MAAALAILTRPNLVPLAAFVFLVIAVGGWNRRSAERWWLRPLTFAALVAPACLAVAWLNTQWYGSPFRSGYEPLANLYAWSHLGTNLRQFGGWLVDSQTAAILLAIAAPLGYWLRRRATSWTGTATTAAVVATIALCYLFYRPFDAWWYLRFLLPAFPALFVLMGAGLAALSSLLPRPLAAIAAALVIGALTWHGLTYSVEHAVFTRREAERKYTAVGEYVARTLPQRAALIALQHSGSARHYSGRLTLRYERIARDQLDAVIEDLRGRGYHPYILLESWEEPQFRAYYKGRSTLASLGWAPVAELVHEARGRLYDPLHHTAPSGDRPPTEYFD